MLLSPDLELLLWDLKLLSSVGEELPRSPILFSSPEDERLEVADEASLALHRRESFEEWVGDGSVDNNECVALAAFVLALMLWAEA